MPADRIAAELEQAERDATLFVLEEHQQALALYSRHSTQWRTGAAGATGLDYNVLYQAMERMDLPNARQLELIDEVGLIEAGILAGWAERRERDKGDK